MKKTIFSLLASAILVFAQPITVNKAGHHNVSTVAAWSNSFFNVTVRGNNSQIICGKARFGASPAYAYFWNSCAARDAGDTSAVTVVAGIRGIPETGGNAVFVATPRNGSGDSISIQFDKSVALSGTQNFDIVLMNASTEAVQELIGDSLTEALRSGTGDVDVGTVTAGQYFLPLASAHVLGTAGDGQPRSVPVVGSGDTLPSVQWVRANPSNLAVISALAIGTNGSGTPVAASTVGTGSSLVKANVVAGTGDSVPTVAWVRANPARTVDSLTVAHIYPTAVGTGVAIKLNTNVEMTSLLCTPSQYYGVNGGGGSAWFGIATNGGLTVMGGTSGAAQRTTDAINYLPTNSGTNNLIYAAGYGLGKYWFVGSLDADSTGGFSQSTDGVIWTATAKLPVPVAGVIDAGACNSLGCVFTGSSSKILTTSDFLTFTNRTLGGTTNQIRGMTWDALDSLFISAGGNGEIRTSPDGITWTFRASGVSQLWWIASGGGKNVAVGQNGTIITSSNGTTWAAATSGVTKHLYSASYGNGLWIVTGDSLAILTSPDAITWTQRTPPAAYTDGSRDLYGTVWDGTQYITAGEFGAVMTSPNGITWTARGDNIPACFEKDWWTNDIARSHGYAGSDSSWNFRNVGAKKVAATDSITIGADTKWYRSAANMMRTPDSVTIDGRVIIAGAVTGAASNWSGLVTGLDFQATASGYYLPGGNGELRYEDVVALQSRNGKQLVLFGADTIKLRNAPVIIEQTVIGAASTWSGTANFNGQVLLGGATLAGVPFGVRYGTDENLFVRHGTDIGGTGIGIDALNDANSAVVPLTIRGNPVKIVGDAAITGTLTGATSSGAGVVRIGSNASGYRSEQQIINFGSPSGGEYGWSIGRRTDDNFSLYNNHADLTALIINEATNALTIPNLAGAGRRPACLETNGTFTGGTAGVGVNPCP